MADYIVPDPEFFNIFVVGYDRVDVRAPIWSLYQSVGDGEDPKDLASLLVDVVDVVEDDAVGFLCRQQLPDPRRVLRFLLEIPIRQHTILNSFLKPAEAQLELLEKVLLPLC